MREIILIAVIALTITGCSTSKAKVKGENCIVHVEDKKSTIECTDGSFEFEGRLVDINILNVDIPNLPDRD